MPLSADAKRYADELFQARESELLKERKLRSSVVRQNLHDIDDAARLAGYPGVLQPEIDCEVARSIAKKDTLCHGYEWDRTPLDEDIIARIEAESMNLLQQSLAGLVDGEKGRIAMKAQRMGRSDLSETEKINELARHLQRTVCDTQKAIHGDLTVRMLEAKKARSERSPGMKVGDLSSKIERFYDELNEHFRLWQESLEQPLPDRPVRNIARLTEQQNSLSRQLGTLRPYLVQMGLPTAMGTGLGDSWDAYTSAVSNDVAARKGSSIEAILPGLQQALGILESRNPATEFELKRENMPSPQHVTIHQHGPQSRVNLNSADYSQNILNASEQTVFSQIREALQRGVSDHDDLKTILAKLDDFASSVHHPSSLEKFQAFINNAASYMTLLAPFIPQLTAMLGN